MLTRNEKAVLRAVIESIEIDLMQGVNGTLPASLVQNNVNARLDMLRAWL